MTRKSACELVRKGTIKHIPKDSVDNGGHANCLGYEDSMTDDALDACKRCERFWRNGLLWFAEHGIRGFIVC